MLAGCLTEPEDTSTGNPNWEASTNLETTYGGYTFTAEAEAFGDPQVRAVAALEGDEIAAPDTMPNDSTFVLRILWGQLDGNPEAAAITDWSGAVSVSAGGLHVLRTIAFERPRDHLLPRTSRLVVGFTSQTQPHFDGLLLAVHKPASDGATLTFATGPYTNTWTLAELEMANLVIPVGDAGDAVSITGSPRRPDDACPHGFVRGAWATREGERGIFRGLWLGPEGNPAGHIRGHFGVNEAGEHVLFAKILGPRGRLIGVARGTYTPSADPMQPGGTFEARYETRAGVPGGTVSGHYLPGRTGERGAAGFFEGRWAADCGTGGEGDPTN